MARLVADRFCTSCLRARSKLAQAKLARAGKPNRSQPQARSPKRERGLDGLHLRAEHWTERPYQLMKISTMLAVTRIAGSDRGRLSDCVAWATLGCLSALFDGCNRFVFASDMAPRDAVPSLTIFVRAPQPLIDACDRTWPLRRAAHIGR